MIKKIIIVGLYHLIAMHPTYCADQSKKKISLCSSNVRTNQQALSASANLVWRVKQKQRNQKVSQSLVWREKSMSDSRSNVVSKSSKTLTTEKRSSDGGRVVHKCALDQLLQKSFREMMSDDLSISQPKISNSIEVSEGSFSYIKLERNNESEEDDGAQGYISPTEEAVADSFSGDESDVEVLDALFPSAE